MNDYITLDGHRYKTSAKTWHPEPNVPGSARILLNGDLDATFGAASVMMWTGEIIGPVTATDPWGTIADLRTTLAKRQTFTMVDHYGTSYTVVFQGPFPERSLTQKWDSPTNEIMVKVRVMGK